MKKSLLPLEIILIYSKAPNSRRRAVSALLGLKKTMTNEELAARPVTQIQYRKIILTLNTQKRISSFKRHGKTLMKKFKKNQRKSSLSKKKVVIL